MKNLIFKSSFHEKLKMLLVLIGVFLVSINIATATNVTGASIKYDVNNSTNQWWNVSSTAKQLNQVYTFKLKGFWAQLNNGDVCENTCMYYGFTSACSLGNYNIKSPNSWNDWPRHFQTESMDVNILSGLSPNKYTLYAKFIGHGNTGCSNVESSTYQMKFEYPAYLSGDGTWCGTEWNATADAQKMTYGTDYYTKTVSSVTNVDHKLKVATYNWASSWGHAKYDAANSSNVYSESNADGNIKFQPAMAGDVTIKFKISDQTISIICAAPTITLDDEGGSEGDGSLNTYYGEAPTSVTVPEKDGYSFAGYWTGDDGTGTQVIGANGAWLRNVANYTNNDATWKWIVRGNSTLHAKWTQDPTLTLSGVSTTSLVSGESVTITVVRGNSSANITYQYKIGSGSWTNIATTSAQTYTYTVPEAHDATQTYYFRATMTDGSTYTTAASSAISVYGKKTIKVKDTNGWGTYFRIHRWGGDATGTIWPGETANITSAGGQWKQVVLYSSSENFLFDKSSDPDNNKTSNQTYASMVDDGCYEIGSTAGGSMSFTKTNNCPTAPTSVTTTATPTSVTNVKMTLNGSIGTNGNDNITDYGFYYGPTNACDTKAQIATSNKTGDISKEITGLTAGTTYFFKAYATNGQGTTYGDVKSFTVPYKVTITKPTGCASMSPTGTQYTSTYIDITASASAGYDFTSWDVTNGTKTSETSTSLRFTPSSDNATVTATYTAQTYTNNTLNKTTGSTDGKYSVTYNATTLSVTTAPAKTGYDVEGYYKTYSSGTWTTKVATSAGALQANTGYTDGSSQWNQTEGKTLYTKWKAQTYTAANNLNKTTGSANGKYTATYDATTIAINTEPTKTGYHVEGYYETFSSGTYTTLVATPAGVLQASTGYTDANSKWNVTSNQTLYTKWEASTYTVNFNQHDATIVGTESTTATYDAAMPSVTVPQKDGYIFGGYWTGENGTGTQYYNADGTSARTWNIASTTTLHAKWTGVSYLVAFNPNGGTGSMSNQSHTCGTSKALTSNTFTRDGYYFLGWNTNADGSGTAFYNGKTVTNLTTTPGAIVTLHAQWAQKRRLHFLNMGTSGWQQGGTAAATTRYAYAFISYDGHIMYPLGTYSAGSKQGTKMTAEASVTLTNVNNGMSTWCWYIDGVPDGATIIFSDNTNSHKTGDLSGWTVEKPYYCNANGTWYALDGTNRIDQMTEMSVSIGEGDFSSWKFFALNKPETGNAYAIVNLTKNQTYQYKYYNWRTNTYSGATGNDAYIINGSSTTRDYTDTWSLNGDKNVMLKTNSHASGEYKFELTWTGGTPRTTVYLPRGVNITPKSSMEAPVGESVTVSLQADAWTNLSTGIDMDNPTYYFEFSTDNSNWNTIATVSPTSGNKKQATASYTFAAQKGYFRVKLVNDNGLASYSGTTTFSAFSTKSFYVYNPWTSSGWSTLHLYTWDSNDGNKTYNGSWPGKAAGSCEHGNNIVSKDGGWFYITINENANKFQLVGDASYDVHKTVDCEVVNYSPDAKYMLLTRNSKNYVEAYTEKSTADYRLLYSYGSPKQYRSSDIFNTYVDGTTPIASMWMNANDGTASIVLQQYSGTAWSAKATYSNSSKNGFGGIVPSGKRDHGYVFQMDLTLNGASSSISNVTEYTGPFYVRTDGLDGGWNVYKKSDHTMHYSAISMTGTPAYNYYLCKWISVANTNVKFTIANEYNRELVNPLEGDVSSTQPLYNRQTIPTATNVRFAWNTETNTLTRAYLSAAQETSSRFLVLHETTSPIGKIYNESGQSLVTGQGRDPELEEHELIFADNGNWVYQINLMANPGAKAKVTAKYNEKEPEFVPSTTLISGTANTKYKYRIVYDFKTNMLTSAWIAGEVNENIDLNTNVMIIRSGQDAADQLTFDGTYKIQNAKKLIGVMQFNYNDMVNKMSKWNTTAYQYCMYYISFPFDVNVKDIFGTGTYGVDYRLQYYDGAARASQGFFTGDGTKTFWKDVPADGKLSANVGYSLLLNRIKFNNSGSDVWENKTYGSSVYLYFPSAAEVSADKVIKEGAAEVSVPSHLCNIDKEFESAAGRTVNHKFTDSHWNMMGIPLFQSATTTDGAHFIALDEEGHTTTPFPSNQGYFYEWDYATNSFSVRAASGYTFKSTHGYMVQFTGTVHYTGSSVQPASVAARRAKMEEENYTVELNLLQDETTVSRTFVELREEACDTFALNEDVYMLYTSRPADMFTMSGGYDVSANVLSMNSQVVPLGLDVRTEGTYTIAMPKSFNGSVTLIDTQTQTRTDLALFDYQVELTKGISTDRFLLEINIEKVTTSLETSDGNNVLNDGGVHKFIKDNQLYILKNGIIYDARGARVQ